MHRFLNIGWPGASSKTPARARGTLGTVAVTGMLLSMASPFMSPTIVHGAEPQQSAVAAPVNRLDLERIAHDLIAAAPPADDGDAKARDEAGAKLSHCESLLDACGETILWGGFDVTKGYDPETYTLTKFAPMVWARMYLSQFMLTGEHTIRREQEFDVLELSANFRRNLDAGDYPYPLWHSASKWQAHLNVTSIMLVAKQGRIIAAYRNAPGNAILHDRRWDGNWQWTTPEGATQPRVALFEYLLSPENPHREKLETNYRKLEEGFRHQGCMTCHAPDNPAQGNPLVLLLYPNQSLGARHQLVEELKRNHMPPLDPTKGAVEGIRDDKVRAELIVLAQEFAREGDAALAFELQPQGESTRPAAAQTQPQEQSGWKTLSDDWYSLTLGGVHAGWMRVAREDDGTRYRTVTEMAMKARPADMHLDVDSFVEWTETHDGAPLRMALARRNKAKQTNLSIGDFSAWEQTRDGDPLGLLTFNRAWEFDGKNVTKIAYRQDVAERIPDVFPDGPWLTPVAAERFIARRIKDDARAIEYGTIDAPENLRYVSIKSTLVGRSEFALDGTLIPVTVWQTQTSVNPGKTVSYYSQDGKMLYSSINLGLGLLETRKCTKEEALTPTKAATAPANDHPVITPDRPLTGQKRAVFEVRLKNDTLPRLPSAGAQVVELLDEGRVARINVDATRTSAATAPELAEAQIRDRAPVFNESESKVMLNLAAQSMREATGLGQLELATSSQTVVQRHFAILAVRAAAAQTAATTPAASKPTTGAEQAAMLCEVLRVHQIPARLVSGLAYVSQDKGAGAFEWRIWMQAMVDENWRDFDPTGPTDFGVGHILTGVGGLGVGNGNPDPADFEKLLPDTQIKIISQE